MPATVRAHASLAVMCLASSEPGLLQRLRAPRRQPRRDAHKAEQQCRRRTQGRAGTTHVWQHTLAWLAKGMGSQQSSLAYTSIASTVRHIPTS